MLKVALQLTLVATTALAIVVIGGCSDNNATRLVSPRSDAVKPNHGLVDAMREPVATFCGNCHANPSPANIVKADWPREVAQGFGFYRSSGRSDLAVPSQEQVTRYFVEQAAEQLVMPASIVNNPPSKVRFKPLAVTKSNDVMAPARPPCISHLRLISLNENETALVYCDLGTGGVYAHWPRSMNRMTKRLAVLYQPVHAEPCDLDRDARMDLIVADLGEFFPADSDLGRVVWLRRSDAGEDFEAIVIAEGLGRVADVRPADFDGDGDIDLLVAEFGYRKTGRILMLDNTGVVDQGIPQFETRVIDKRHGTIHLPPVDLNQDGHLDFVALISQEHEVVEAFINDGSGNFQLQRIWSAPDPTYGSSGIELADLDNDGDTDVIYSNGDSFDHGTKPYHSVQWLENRGEFPFTHHHLTNMPGVLAIKVADFDRDGDLDIVAGAMMPMKLDPALEAAGVESIVILEQAAVGKFKRTRIETSQSHHGTIEVGDFDLDGRIDIAVGNFFRAGETGFPDFTIWHNQGESTTKVASANGGDPSTINHSASTLNSPIVDSPLGQ